MTDTVVDTSNDLADLASLGEALSKSAGKIKDQEKIKDAILDKIGTLDADTAKALLKDERVQALLDRISHEKAQASNDPPGTILPGWIGNAQVHGFTKKEWSENDLRNDRERKPGGAGTWVTFTPVETIPVFWNGLRRQLIADEEITIEKCFKDVYDEHRRAGRLAGEHAAWLFHKRDTLTDPTMATAEGARARGMVAENSHGWYVPGGGGIITAQAPPTEGEQGAASGGGEES